MRTADPGEATLTLKNPKLDGSSLAKRRKTKLEPVGKTDGGKNEESSEGESDFVKGDLPKRNMNIYDSFAHKKMEETATEQEQGLPKFEAVAKIWP